jgi:hypothetical protein
LTVFKKHEYGCCFFFQEGRPLNEKHYIINKVAASFSKVLAGDSLANVKMLLFIFLVLCMSTVPCEQGFSLMALIKDKLRNCLHTDTVDAHMMIASNGPDMTDKVAVRRVLDAAKKHWQAQVKRCPNRSNPGKAGRPKKAATSMKLTDLLLAKAREAQRATGSAGSPLCEEDEDPNLLETIRAEQDLLEEDIDMIQQLQDSVGPLTIPGGFQIVSKPSCASQSLWAAECKKSFWVGKRLAHITPDGWHLSSFRRKLVGAGAVPEEGWVFYCRDTRLDYIHRLLIEDYGLTLAWVILEKEIAREDDDQVIYARQYTRRAHATRNAR